MHRGLHPRSSVDRLNLPRAQGGRALLSVKDCIELERSNLFDYAASNNERLLKAATKELQLRTNIDGKNKDRQHGKRKHYMVNSWEKERGCKIKGGGSGWKQMSWNEKLKPLIVVIDKQKRECKIIDIVVPGDQNIKVKELEKIIKYQDLRLQVQTFWDVKATVIPIEVGALGTICEELENHLKTIGIPIVISCLQRAALPGTAFIFRRVLDNSESG